MKPEERYELITRNLEEVLGEDELKSLLKSKKEIILYWGTMPTGSLSVAYFFPMLKIADFLKAGIKVKILLADLHAALDSTPWDLLEKRYLYYKEAIITLLKTIGVEVKNLEFVKGSDIQLKPEYMHDLLKLSTETTVAKATKSAAEVVKLGNNPKLSGLVYPLMQALDEVYLKADIQYGGLDQRKIFVYAREFLPKIGYNSRIELMNPMIRGLVGEKMSSSIEASKIDILDSEDDVKKKMNKADCVAGNPDNGIMALMKYLVMVMKQDSKQSLVIERPEKFGGNLEFKNYQELELDFKKQSLHPLDLKMAAAKEINTLLASCRSNKKLVKYFEEAYSK